MEDSGTANPPPHVDASVMAPGVDAGTGTHPTDASTGGHDAADAAPPAAINAFTGAGGYTSQPVGTSAQQEHQNRGVGIVPTGNNCLDCHGQGAQTTFGFAGTIYKDAQGTTGAADVEVRVVDAQGRLYGSVHSDQNGDFWLPDNATFPQGAFSGARNGTTTVLMPSNPTKGGCNSNGCHDANQRLHIP